MPHVVVKDWNRYVVKSLLCKECGAGFQARPIGDVRAIVDNMLCDRCGEIGEEVWTVLTCRAGVGSLCSSVMHLWAGGQVQGRARPVEWIDRY